MNKMVINKSKSDKIIYVLLRLLLVVVLFVMALNFFACSRSDNAEWEMAPQVAYAPVSEYDFGLDLYMAEEGISLSGAGSVYHFYSTDMVDEVLQVQIDSADQIEWEDIAGQGQRHVIQTANIEMDTEDFGEVVDGLRQLAPAVGGYIESEMLSAQIGRMFTIVLRVPVAYFYDVLYDIGNLADIRVMNQRAEDVTDQFYDLIGSLELRRIEEDRLLALIEEAVNIHELLALEQRLSNTRLNIDLYLSQLNNLAGRVAFSTITINLFDISEVERYVPAEATIRQRISGAFGDSVEGTTQAFQNIIVFFASAIIPIILLVLLGLVIYKTVKAVVRTRKSRITNIIEQELDM